MNIDQKILAGYIEAMAKPMPGPRLGLSTTEACVVMDTIGANMADNATPAERRVIFQTMDEVRRYVLDRASKNLQ